MPFLRFLLPICVPILFAGSIHAQNLIQNGSFESPDVAGGTAQVFPNGGVPGWTDTSVQECGIEIQDNCCGSPIHGDQFMEVDSNCPSLVTQTVTTQSGASYVLSFDYSPRPGLQFGNSDVDISWNGNVVATGDGIAIGDTDWRHLTVGVTATGTSSTVEFSESPLFANPTDGVGGYIDNVPEPARSEQLAAGVSLLVALHLRHRRTLRSRPGGRSR